MTKWVTSPTPSAQLELESPEPEMRDDGAEVRYYRTKYGVRFSEVREPSGFVLWLREVPT